MTMVLGLDLKLWALILGVSLPVLPIGLAFGKSAAWLYFPVAWLLFIGIGYLMDKQVQRVGN